MSGAGKFRFGFWVEAGENLSEAFSCGWGYKPLGTDLFGCYAYTGPKHVESILKDKNSFKSIKIRNKFKEQANKEGKFLSTLATKLILFFF